MLSLILNIMFWITITPFLIVVFIMGLGYLFIGMQALVDFLTSRSK